MQSRVMNIKFNLRLGQGAFNLMNFNRNLATTLAPRVTWHMPTSKVALFQFAGMHLGKEPRVLPLPSIRDMILGQFAWPCAMMSHMADGGDGVDRPTEMGDEKQQQPPIVSEHPEQPEQKSEIIGLGGIGTIVNDPADEVPQSPRSPPPPATPRRSWEDIWGQGWEQPFEHSMSMEDTTAQLGSEDDINRQSTLAVEAPPYEEVGTESNEDVRDELQEEDDEEYGIYYTGDGKRMEVHDRRNQQEIGNYVTGEGERVPVFGDKKPKEE